MEKSKLVIITVVLNDINGLKKTIDSLKCMSDKIRSHFIFDGGSSDGTDHFLSAYKSNKNLLSHNIDYFIEKDKGIFDAMNKSISQISKLELNQNDYIWFLNAGDLAIDFRLPLYDLSDLDLLFYNCEVFFSNFNKKIDRPGHLSNNEFINWLKLDTPVHQAVLFSTRIIHFLNFDLLFKHQADSKLIYELVSKFKYRYEKQSICLFEYGGNSSNYKKKQKCLEQLSEQIFILVMFRNASWFQILKVTFIFLIKYLLTNLLGVKLFERFHFVVLNLKFILTKLKIK